MKLGLYSITYLGCCRQLPVVNGETVGIEFAHKNAQLAAEFMREILRSASGPNPDPPATRQPVGAAPAALRQ